MQRNCGLKSLDDKIIEGDFLKLLTHFKTDAIFIFDQFSVFRFGVYVTIMFEEGKVGLRLSINYCILILVHVCYAGLKTGRKRIFKSKEGNNIEGGYPF